MGATQRGIYHNLKESKYTVSNSEIVFFFSSEVYLRKFLDRYESHRVTFKERFERAYNNNPYDVRTLSDIDLYSRIEKRGFRCLLHGLDITLADLHDYALRNMRHYGTLEWKQTDDYKPCKRIQQMGV